MVFSASTMVLTCSWCPVKTKRWARNRHDFFLTLLDVLLRDVPRASDGYFGYLWHSGALQWTCYRHTWYLNFELWKWFDEIYESDFQRLMKIYSRWREFFTSVWTFFLPDYYCPTDYWFSARLLLCTNYFCDLYRIQAMFIWRFYRLSANLYRFCSICYIVCSKRSLK